MYREQHLCQQDSQMPLQVPRHRVEVLEVPLASPWTGDNEPEDEEPNEGDEVAGEALARESRRGDN